MFLFVCLAPSKERSVLKIKDNKNTKEKENAHTQKKINGGYTTPVQNRTNKQKVIIVIIREVSSGLVFLLLSINLLGQL